MSATTKGFAEIIVDKCLENPKFALFVVPLGIALLFWGISDARYYRSMADRPTRTMKEATIESRPNDRGFTIPHVVGECDGEEISIPISAKAARRLEIGDEIEVVETAENSNQYLLRSSVDEQASSIFFNVAGIPFNFIGILGLVIAIGACLWAMIAKPKDTDSGAGSNDNHSGDDLRQFSCDQGASKLDRCQKTRK